MDIAAEQRPSRQRTNKIASNADPCVVPREIECITIAIVDDYSSNQVGKQMHYEVYK